MLPCQESNASDLNQSNQIDALSPAEKSVVNLLLEGLSNRCIAKRLVLSPRTVESHISHALAKTGCHSRLELTLWLLTTQQQKRCAAIAKLS